MEVGHIVDYCEEWNRHHEVDEDDSKNERKTEGKRMMTQAEINAFLG